jgi:putative cardiolipin synthase
MNPPARLVASICCCYALLLAGGCSEAPLDFPRTASFAFHSPGETTLGRALEPQAAAHPGESGVYLLAGGGPAALVARTVLVDAAEKSIDVQYFMFEDDRVSNFLLDRLVAAADRGVHVRMLLDDYWQTGRDRRLAGIGAHPNIELRVFNPVGGDRAHKATRTLNYGFGPTRIRGRMHNKSMIVDAAAAVVGGRNIADEYFAASSDFNYGDVDMVVVGQAVRDIAQTFDQYWNAPLAVPIEAFVPARLGPECLAELRHRLAETRAEAKDSVYAQRLRESDLLQLVQAREVPFVWGRDEALADAPGKSLLKREESPSAFMAVRLMEVMGSAKREVLMVSPYFVPGKDGVKWLSDTRSRGVSIKVITNSLASTDVFAAQGGYQRYRKAMLRAGVELFELRPDPERTGPAAEVHRGNTARAALHAKIFVIDREAIFVGSHNLDPRSSQLDSQNGIVIHSPELAAQLAGVFDQVTTPAYTYRVRLDQGRLKWTTQRAGRPIEYDDDDPETSCWRRFKTAILGAVSPEQWL